QIQDLIKFVAKSGVNEVSIEQPEFKITIKTNTEPPFVSTNITAQQALPSAAAPVQAPAPAAPAEAKSSTEGVSKLITIKSPMIGTFYRSASREKPSFVNIGDSVSAGQVICIVEAMKLFN